MDRLSIDAVGEYARTEATTVCQLVPILAAELEKDGLTSILRDVELPLIPVLARMERNGIAVDVPYLQSLSNELAGRLAEIETETYASVGHEFNINSPSKLGDVLFEELNLPQSKRTRTGAGVNRRRRAGGASRRPPDHRPDPGAPPASEAEVDLRRRAAADGQSRDPPRPHLVQPDDRRDGAPLQHRPEPPEHPDPHRSRQAGASGVRDRLAWHDAC